MIISMSITGVTQYITFFVAHLHFAQVIAQHNDDHLQGLLVVVKLKFIVSYYYLPKGCPVRVPELN